MLCWSSWANIRKLGSKDWRFKTFYWDYVWGIIITSLIFTFTFWSVGVGGRSFLADYQQADGQNIQSSLIGGVVFNTANILLVSAITIAGVSVTFPVGILDGMIWRIGMSFNIIASGKSGAVISYGLGQGVTIVVAIGKNLYLERI